MERWFELDNATAYVDITFGVLSFLAHRAKPSVMGSLIKAMCNGWCTGRRFQKPDSKCLFCDAFEDSIEHICRCEIVAQCGSDFFKQSIWRVGPPSILMCDRSFLADPITAHMFAIHWFAVYQVHNKLRNGCLGDIFGKYRATIKALAVQHDFSRKTVRYHQGVGDNPLAAH